MNQDFETDAYGASFLNYGGTFFTNGHKNKKAKLSILQSQEQYKDLESASQTKQNRHGLNYL